MSTDLTETVLAWLRAREDAMVALLAELVDQDSGSYDKAGVDAVGARLIRFFAEHGIAAATRADATFGDAITAHIPGTGPSNRPIVLMGHRDTVFPKGEAGRRPFRIENGRASGPGVADMKAGLVMNAFLLAAFHQAGGAASPLVALVTSDEEIGSPSSRALIEDTARGARAVLNAEPGRPSGNVVTGRKGGVFMECTVTGKAAHSGGNFAEGVSAIREVAHKITALSAITDLDAGITLNVGLVSGGQSVNTIAPAASIGIDLRYVERPQRDEAMARVRAICEGATIPGTRSDLAVKGEFLPLVPDDGSRALFSLYQEAARGAGLAVEGEFAGGCADSGFTSAVGCPTICSVGPVGGRAHSPEEYLEVASILPRAEAAARAIVALG